MASNETSSDSVGDSQNEITTNSANTIVIQDADDYFVKITIKVPGLKTRRLLSLKKIPKNGRIAEIDYRKNTVYLKFILNEGKPTQNEYVYTSKEPLRGNIEQEKSIIKFEDNTIRWSVRKSCKWN